MSTYLVTVSWADHSVQTLRHKETVEVELDISVPDVWNVLKEIKAQNRYCDFISEEIAVEFMFKLGE